MKKEKKRLDCILVERKLAESRTLAKALIMSGVVFVEGEKIEKAGTMVDLSSEISVKSASCPYVGRGGLKLEGVINEYEIDVHDKIAVDIGASTGGFTDCLLQKGARRVYAIDTGRGQLHWKLRNDHRVISMEKVNARYIAPDIIPEKADIMTIDVSFISVKKIIDPVSALLKENGTIISLIKPQFEIGKGLVDKGGIIKSPDKHRIVLEGIVDFFSKGNILIESMTTSPIKGQQGNKEFFAILRKGTGVFRADFDKIIDRII